ncbi:MAG TPA: biosynthetic peptidoglycan transglycosylase, partial [Chloroflexota bacterium]|nr:biosynthetic peptidoglycan transglycosylase [Chloroflexota bacterium]
MARRLRRQRGIVVSRFLGVGAVLAVIAFLATELYLATLPSVAGAPARVQALLTQHGGLPVSTPPTRVAAATVAVEDRRFYVHHGLDSLGLLRAGWDVVTTGSPHGGATITEQLAQALYVTTDDSLGSHLEKAGLAVKLEQRYSKQAILTMYLNAVYYGDGQWGIAQASHAYFGVAPTALSWGAASMLAGLPNAPSAYDPRHHYTLARERERLVLIAL